MKKSSDQSNKRLLLTSAVTELFTRGPTVYLLLAGSKKETQSGQISSEQLRYTNRLKGTRIILPLLPSIASTPKTKFSQRSVAANHCTSVDSPVKSCVSSKER